MTAVIESPRNPRLAEARRFGRQPGEWVLAEGPVVVAEAMRAGAEVRTVFATEEALSRHPGLAAGAPVELVSEKAMKGVSEADAPQGIVAVVRNPSLSLSDLLSHRPARVLVLTDVRDPGNVGTALRAAEGAGFDGAIVARGSCDPANSKVVRSSAGAVFHLAHAARVPAREALEALAPWRRVGAAADGDVPLRELRVEGPVAVVVGNEAWGFTPEVAALLDLTVAIPMRGRLASLNAGVAAALVVYAVAGL